MNERIQEIAELADAYAWAQIDQGANFDEQPQYFAEKFAELIVKECVCTLQGMHLWQSVNNQNYPNAWHDAVDQGVDAIKEHFGVEE